MDSESLKYMEDVKKKKPRKFVLIYKGVEILQLLVFRKGQFSTRLQRALKEGPKGPGRCWGIAIGNGMDVVFQMSTDEGFTQDPVKPLTLKSYLKDQTGTAYKPRFEFVSQSELNTVTSSIDTEDAGAGTTTLESAPAPNQAPPAVPDGGKAENLNAAFSGRLRALILQIKQAAGTELGNEAKLLAGQAGALAREMEFTTAHQVLDKAEALFENARTDAAAQPASADLSAKLTDSLKKLKPVVQKAIAAAPDRKPELIATLTQIAGEVKTQQLDIAKQHIREFASLLKSIGSTPASGTAKGTRVAFTQARLSWDSARKTVQSELSKLESSILATLGRIPAISQDKLGELASATKKLYTILDRLDERLIDKLDEALVAENEQERSQLNQQAASIVKEYQHFVNSDPLIKDLDQNPFTPVNVQAFMTKTLTDLETRLV